VQVASFKQYREADGQFYFKLVDAQGRLLVQSDAFASPKDAGARIAELKRNPAAAAALTPVAGVTAAEVSAALQELTAAGN
jgi:tryptophanyl-tRNA synthetase